MTDLPVETIRNAIANFPDPETGRPIDSMGQLKDVSVSGNRVTVTLALASHSLPIADEVSDALQSRIEAAAPGAQVTFEIVDHPRPPARSGQIALRKKRHRGGQW